MKQHRLTIEASFRPEMVERILRVVRHRGFQICTMNLVSDVNTGKIVIDMTVTSPRSVDLLTTQLNKLLDVTNVQVR